MVRGEEQADKDESPSVTIDQSTVFSARKEIHAVHVSESIEKYIVALIDATRFPEKFSKELEGWLDYGASPRGSLAFEKCGRVHAWMNERDFVTPDDIRVVAHDVLRHRIVPSYEANADAWKESDYRRIVEAGGSWIIAPSSNSCHVLLTN